MIDVVVMAHPKRDAQAHALAVEIDATIVWDQCNDEWDTGSRAWQAAHNLYNEWGLVVQDDAVPIPDFRHHLDDVLQHAPRTAVSLYVGTGRPRADTVKRAAQRADRVGAAWLQCASLLWGVALLLPTEHITPMLHWCQHRTEPYDQRISRYYRTVLHRPVRYTWPSLVDHADEPSLVNHTGRPDVPRHAHRTGPWQPGGPVVTL